MFSKLFENNPALMVICDLPEARIVDVNASFVEKLGYSKEETIGKLGIEAGILAEAEDVAKVKGILSETMHARDIDVRLRCKDGRILNSLLSFDLFEFQDTNYLMGVVVDITEKVSNRNNVLDQVRRLASIIEGTRLATWEWNVRTGELTLNERWAQIVGHTLAELSPVTIETWRGLMHPDDLVRADALLEAHFRGDLEDYQNECRMRHKNGGWVWVLAKGKVVERDGAGNPLMMLGTHSDITDRKVAEKRVEELSTRDPLTNAYNRRYALERLDEALSCFRREGKPFSVAILDIDHFKRLNDTYGHLTGDRVLKAFASLVEKGIRPYDIFARFGGEEFLVVMKDVRKQDTAKRVGSIKSTVAAASFEQSGAAVRFSFSAGVSDTVEFMGDAFSVKDLLQKADERLYRAKRRGRNRVVCDDKA